MQDPTFLHFLVSYLPHFVASKNKRKIYSFFLRLASVVTTTVRALSTQAVKPTTASSVVKTVSVPGLKNGMDYQRLGDSDLVVSKVCMGTMTFGQQNTLEEGVQQLNTAFDKYGINFVDTAEMYPVPTKADTQGSTDRTVAQFLKGRSRDSVILATKVAGRAPYITWLPRRQAETPAELTKEQIIDSVEASLQRLGVDYIDLLQLHWPDRYTGGLFGSPDFLPSLYEEKPAPHSFEEQLEALQHLIQQGKVRYVGVSNETPFGVASFCHLAQQYPDLYPKIVSIQNSYSMIVRKTYEAGLSEMCYHHNVGLLAYSPLGAGILSGKYRDPTNIPKGSRLDVFPGFQDRYRQSLTSEAVNAYCTIAERHGLTPTNLALAWCYHNQLVASSIIGATTMTQLEENLKSYDVRLTEDIQKEITKVYLQYPDPTRFFND